MVSPNYRQTHHDQQDWCNLKYISCVSSHSRNLVTRNCPGTAKLHSHSIECFPSMDIKPQHHILPTIRLCSALFCQWGAEKSYLSWSHLTSTLTFWFYCFAWLVLLLPLETKCPFYAFSMVFSHRVHNWSWTFDQVVFKKNSVMSSLL